MAVVISYARQDKAAVDVLRRDIESAHRQVWVDDTLTGGQAWWDAILAAIRQSEVFVFALSPSSLRSNPCMAELHYALALGRPVMPVRLRDVDPRVLPPAIGNAHMVDYTHRTPENVIALMNALNAWPPPGPALPHPLPPPSPVPVEYLDRVREQIDAPSLGFDDQDRVLRDLRGRLNDEDQAELARTLLARLRARHDIGESLAREIDAVLAGGGAGAAAGASGGFVPPGASGGFVPPGAGAGPPSGGFATPGPPPGAPPPQPPFVSPPGAGPLQPWTAGGFAALILLSFFIPFVGAVVWLSNLRHQPRQGQAWAMLGAAVVGGLFWFWLVSALAQSVQCYDPFSDTYYAC
jgi:hypothetical protein